MKFFDVSTDSTCDLYKDEISSLNIFVAHLEYSLNYNDNLVLEVDDYSNYEQYVDFYNKLRKGVVAKTSILSVQAHVDLFTKMAESGVKNAIHISQGYGLSPTVDNANAAIKIVKERFKDINFVAIECNSTTVGEGIIVRACCQLRDEGVSLNDAIVTLNKIKHFTQHFVLVNDLKFLARGGRISSLSANLGSMFQVKPILQFGKDGKLKVCKKEIGVNKALKNIVNEFKNFSLNNQFSYIYIVHTDNLPLALKLREMFNSTYNIDIPIRIMGPIIGAHVGPDAVAVAFLSNEIRPND